jgi:hypothetical protein
MQTRLAQEDGVALATEVARAVEREQVELGQPAVAEREQSEPGQAVPEQAVRELGVAEPDPVALAPDRAAVYQAVAVAR